MRSPQCAMLVRTVACVLALLGAVRSLRAEDSGRVQALEEQNRRLEELVRNQQKTIEALAAKMAEMQRAAERQERSLRDLASQLPTSDRGAPRESDRAHEVHVTAETGIALFNTGAKGQFPNAEFRLDDPVVAIEAPVARDLYLFTELKLLTRESINENFQIGELYADFENVSGRWGKPGLLSLRVGRINTPFGEEYQVRGPVANPLISHSLSDVWGTDEGLEIYGTLGSVRYVLAVQNGGIGRLHDFHADKAVVGRLGWDPVPWLHLSGSAMRTGRLASIADSLSDIWFANGFFRAIGNPATTSLFWADLFEADAVARWKTGSATLALGTVRYDDNDRAVDNERRMRYGYLELVQGITERLYGAARYSEIRAPKGYPMVGGGQPGEYFFRPSLTEELRRLSLGLGYRIAEPVVLKFEYSWNSGHLFGGIRREGENYFGSEIGLRF